MCKPFLKWAGGKSSLLPQITPHIPSTIAGTYYEPFLGGGALFFHLRPKRAVLSDVNPELINAYLQVRDNSSILIQRLYGHQKNHSQAYYYEVRGKRLENLTESERAARFIYLNKTCFNGLHRENKKGEFNVPIGWSKTPWTVDVDGIKSASEALQNAEILHQSIKDFPIKLDSGDFVYFDPPYQSVSKTSNFTSYTKDGFEESDQVYLKNLFVSLAKDGTAIALSNSDHPLIREKYNGFEIHDIQARRSINSKGDGRSCVGEVLVSANVNKRVSKNVQPL